MSTGNLKISRFFLLKQLKQKQTSTIVVQKKNVTTTPVVKASFNVQDEDDFKKRVLDSSKTVIVDFHAV
jgi:hypothetical protein